MKICDILVPILIFHSTIALSQTKTIKGKNINNSPNYGTQYIGDKYYINKKQTFKEKNYIQGIQIPKKIVNSGRYLRINIGGLTYNIEINRLIHGVKFSPNSLVYTDGETPFDLQFYLKGNTLFISTSFRDINGSYIGKINNNKWELRTQKISDYHSSKRNFEVLDDGGYVLFNMHYEKPNFIIINGYFVGDNIIEVANGNNFLSCGIYNSSCKERAIKAIKKIPKLNEY